MSEYHDVSRNEEYIFSICALFQNDIVKEVDFVMLEDQSPILFMEHSLAISLLIIKELYKYSYQSFFEEYKEYKQSLNPTEFQIKRLFNLTLTCLIIKGDLAMAYNARKSLLLNPLNRNPGESIAREILILGAIFSKHPKSPAGWEHRRWCYQQRLLLSNRTKLFLSEIETEKEICYQSADKYPKNYYAWIHRHWLLQYFSNDQLLEEIEFIHQWIYSHPSDHSAVNHAIQVITAISKNQSCLTEFILENTQLIEESNENPLQLFTNILFLKSKQLIVQRHGCDSIWNYRRGIFLFASSKNLLNFCSFDLQSLSIEEKDNFNQIFNTLCQNIEYTFSTSQDLLLAPSSLNPELSNHFQGKPIFLFLFQEITLVLDILQDPNLWNSKSQTRASLHYLAFIITSYNKFIVSSTLSKSFEELFQNTLRLISQSLSLH